MSKALTQRDFALWQRLIDAVIDGGTVAAVRSAAAKAAKALIPGGYCYAKSPFVVLVRLGRQIEGSDVQTRRELVEHAHEAQKVLAVLAPPTATRSPLPVNGEGEEYARPLPHRKDIDD